MPYKDPLKDIDIRNKKNAERQKKYRQTVNGKNKKKEYLQKTSKIRSEKSKEYYKKNKEHILNATKEYQKIKPEIKKKSQQKATAAGKGILKGKRERENLANGYLQAQIRKTKGNKTTEEMAAQILIYRLKKQIKKYE